MAIDTRHFTSLCSLALLALISMATGCCGPMACGPMGCSQTSSGPFMMGGCNGGCGNGCDGCGETYVDEWINHPPKCDPCDCCGNHNGQSCGECRPMFDGFASLWGYRRDCGCEAGCDSSSCDGGCTSGCSGGCSSCGHGDHGHAMEHSMGSAEMVPMDGHYIDSASAIPMSRQPSPAPRIVEAKPMVKQQSGQMPQQMFRPKTTNTASRHHVAPRPRNY